MRGTQPHGKHQPERTTGSVLHGTYPVMQPKPVEGFGDQAAHDKAYKERRTAHLAENPGKRLGVSDDIKIAQGMLRDGADPKKLESSIKAHSPEVGRLSLGLRENTAKKIVADAAKSNHDNQPRDPRENIKPGHETHRASDALKPKLSSSDELCSSQSKQHSPSQEEIAAWHFSPGRSR